MEDDTLNIKELIDRCISHWWWFVISVLIAACIAVLYVKTTPKTYSRRATVVIKDDKKGGSIGGAMEGLADLGFMTTNVNVDNEIVSFTSPATTWEVVRRLELNKNYYIDGFLTRKDVKTRYPDTAVNYLTTVYEEGLYVGYRYFDTFGKSPMWRFGHGLSYTTFEKKILSASLSTVKVSVTNTGGCPGKEVVQLYVRLPEGKLEQPGLRLVAFAKTAELAPGESETLTLSVSTQQLKSYDSESASWIMERGRLAYILDGRCIYTHEIDQTVTVKTVKNRLQCPLDIKELSRHDPDSYPQGMLTCGFTQEKLPYARVRELTFSDTELIFTNGSLITFDEVAANPGLAEQFVAQMSDYELARFSVGAGTGWSADDKGFAGFLCTEAAMEKYGIGSYTFADGNNGVNLFEANIGFPTSATMAATWNEALSYQEGIAIATEARDMGIRCLLAPAMNLHRNILCGRNSEYFSEDPLLAGRMAGQESRGFEDTGISSCVKHFFANNAETMRNMNHSLMTERTARELYLAAFEHAFEVNMPDTVMTGYNPANGCYCSDDPDLLQGILREEFGFTGYVMTDWNGYGDQGPAALCAAGVSWIAPGGTDDTLVTPVVEALRSGTLSRARLQQNVLAIVRVILKYRNVVT